MPLRPSGPLTRMRSIGSFVRSAALSSGSRPPWALIPNGRAGNRDAFVDTNWVIKGSWRDIQSRGVSFPTRSHAETTIAVGRVVRLRRSAIDCNTSTSCTSVGKEVNRRPNYPRYRAQGSSTRSAGRALASALTSSSHRISRTLLGLMNTMHPVASVTENGMVPASRSVPMPAG